jgi:hypothetical protein
MNTDMFKVVHVIKYYMDVSLTTNLEHETVNTHPAGSKLALRVNVHELVVS